MEKGLQRRERLQGHNDSTVKSGGGRGGIGTKLPGESEIVGFAFSLDRSVQGGRGGSDRMQSGTNEFPPTLRGE